MLVRVGNDRALQGGQTYAIQKITAHEKYDESHKMDEHDIAVLRLLTKIVFSENVKPIPLATKVPEEGALGYVTGFGRQEVMRSVRLLKNLYLTILYMSRITSSIFID